MLLGDLVRRMDDNGGWLRGGDRWLLERIGTAQNRAQASRNRPLLNPVSRFRAGQTRPPTTTWLSCWPRDTDSSRRMGQKKPARDRASVSDALDLLGALVLDDGRGWGQVATPWQ